jgi:PHD/YefM family antitoxin component YafN of YafNO toxin-antitoxin module
MKSLISLISFLATGVIANSVLTVNLNMLKYLTINQAQEQLLELSEQLTNEPAIVTQNDLPVLAVINYEQLLSLLETLDIFSDTEFTDQLQESIVQVERGETISWEEAKVKLGL